LSANDFLRKIENPETQLINQLDNYRIEQIKKNGAELALILQNVIFWRGRTSSLGGIQTMG